MFRLRRHDLSPGPEVGGGEMKNAVEKPLGRRELSRLKGDLLCYRDAKDYIRGLGLEHGIRVRAVEMLYRKTGGRNWLSPGQVDAIIEEAKQEAAKTQEATCTTKP
jgi:hypothetical protein